MSNLTSKKQNRILYGILTVLLASAAVLSVLTFNAGKKEAENLPETETKQIGRATEADTPETIPSVPKEKENAEDAGLFGSKKDPAKETEAETKEEKAAKTDAPAEDKTVSAASVLPTFCSPVENGVILQGHSVTVPVFSATMNDYRTHAGIDIACEPASPVLAAADGKIGSFWHDPLMGYTLSVIHSGDAVTIYQGLAEELPEGITAGAEVKAGQVIACSGTTALIECEEEEHLHFMLHIGGKDVDPMEYIALPTMASVYEY